MEIKIRKEVCLELLGTVNKAISGKGITPILDGAHVEVFNNSIKMTGSDTDLTIISTSDEVEIIEEGTFVLDSKLFSDMLKRFPNGEIHIKTDGVRCECRCGETKAFIAISPSEGYPSVNYEGDEEVQVSMTQANLKSLIKGTHFAASTDESRPILKGICMDISNGKFECVALDGYRVAQMSYPIISDSTSQIVVDAKSLLEVSKLMGDSNENVSITFSNNHAIFKVNNTVAIARLLEGDYVNYRALFPQEFATTIVIDKVKLLNALDLATIVSDSQHKMVKMQIQNNKMRISSNSSLGEVDESIAVDCDTESEIAIAFNAIYLKDAIRATEATELEMKISSPIQPTIIREKNENSHGSHIVLPVRLVA